MMSIHEAARNGCLETVKQLVAETNGRVLEDRDRDGDTPLILAAALGQLSVVKYLLEQGASVDATNNYGWTALTLCTRTTSTDEDSALAVIKCLLPFYSSVDASDGDGETALMVAAQRGRERLVEYLVGQGARIDQLSRNGRTPLLCAMANGHIGVFNFLRWRGAEARQALDPNDATRLLSLAFVQAAQYGALTIVEYLLENGVAMNDPAWGGLPALVAAADRGHLPVVEHLVANGADVNAAYSYRRAAALMDAARNGHLEVVEFLTARGAEMNMNTQVRDHGVAQLRCTGIECTPLREGYTAVLLSCQYGHHSVFEHLMQQGVELNATSEAGKRTLAGAAGRGHLCMVEYLMEHGGMQLNRSHRSEALTSAVRHGHVDVARYLIQKAGVDVNAVDGTGNTALLCALDGFQCDLATVECLVELGADLNTKDHRGRHAACYAAQHWRDEAVRSYLNEQLQRASEFNAATIGDI